MVTVAAGHQLAKLLNYFGCQCKDNCQIRTCNTYLQLNVQLQLVSQQLQQMQHPA